MGESPTGHRTPAPSDARLKATQPRGHPHCPAGLPGPTRRGAASQASLPCRRRTRHNQ